MPAAVRIQGGSEARNRAGCRGMSASVLLVELSHSAGAAGLWQYCYPRLAGPVDVSGAVMGSIQ